MEILGVGGWEMVAILLITLVVAGPARMIRWAYQIGRFFAKLRVLWSQAAASLQKEFDAAGVDIQVPKDVPTRQTLRRDLNNMVNPLMQEVRAPLDEVSNEVRRTRSEARNAVSPLKSLNGSGSMSDPMGTAPRKPTPPTATPPLPSFGTWGQPNDSAANAPKTPPPSDFGTWGQPSADKNQPDTSGES